MSEVRVLLVVDGIFSLAPTPSRDDYVFTVSTLLKLLRESGNVLVDTANRIPTADYPDLRDEYANLPPGPDPHATIPGAFNFTSLDLGHYDVLWLMGFSGTNGEKPTKPLAFISDDELIAITEFMNAGGGVFATGDHEGLGSLMCGRIPRVRSMRRWFSGYDDDPRAFGIRNWPGGGPARADTLQIGADGQWQFDNQSDATPQPLEIVGQDAHPILIGPFGAPIRRFPDHMHEGEVATPADPTLDIAFSGTQHGTRTYPEFPMVNGYRELPEVIARGAVIGGHATPLGMGNRNCESQFTAQTDLTAGRPLQILAAYDGHNVGVGRIVTDSSFHHYLDLNLIGDNCAALVPGDTRSTGFRSPAAGDILLELGVFYRNLATWLGTPPPAPAKPPKPTTCAGLKAYIAWAVHHEPDAVPDMQETYAQQCTGKPPDTPVVLE